MDPGNEAVSHIYSRGRSWIAVHFNNYKDLEECITKINNNQNNNKVEMFNMITFENELRKKEKQLNFSLIQKGFHSTTENKGHRTFKILDIPREYSKERVKGALKPYGKIIDFNKIKTNQEKEIVVTLEQTNTSKDLTEVWSIPIRNIMARIAH